MNQFSGVSDLALANVRELFIQNHERFSEKISECEILLRSVQSTGSQAFPDFDAQREWASFWFDALGDILSEIDEEIGHRQTYRQMLQEQEPEYSIRALPAEAILGIMDAIDNVEVEFQRHVVQDKWNWLRFPWVMRVVDAI
jgi:hypothetical protein